MLFVLKVYGRFLRTSMARIAPTIATAAMMPTAAYVIIVGVLSTGFSTGAGAAGAGDATNEVSDDDGQ